MVTSQASVFWFLGENAYQKERAIEELRASVFQGLSNDLDYKVFYGPDVESAEILDYVKTIPFSASKRLAVIKNFDDISSESKTRLMKSLSEPLRSAYLVIDSDDESALSAYGNIPGHMALRRFDELDDPSVASWIKKFLKSQGKDIEPDAVLLLKELQGANMQSLSQEMDKLRSFTGSRTTITVDDVEEMVGKNVTSSAFDIARAVEERKVFDALKIVSELIVSGKSHYEIAGLLCWHFKRILKAKMLLSKGQSDASVVSILKIGRYSNEFLRQVKNFKLDRLKRKMSVLLEADLSIKRTQFDPTMILEFAIIKLCLA